MGRRWGKTLMAGSVGLACANQGASVAWIAPTYKNSRPLWRFVEYMTAPVMDRVYRRRAERTVLFPSGGFIGVYSGDSPVSIRGESFDLVLMDEAARLDEEVWADVIMPTLADRNGMAYLISTPAGRNWYWREYVNAAEGKHDAKAWTAPSSSNPNPNIQRAFEAARTRVSERTFTQEWLAQFITDGTFFQNVTACVADVEQTSAEMAHSYVIGVDWARAADGDYTVFAVVDATIRAVVCVERYSGASYPDQIRSLRLLWQRFGRCPIIAEYNSMGGPMVEMLAEKGMNIVGFTTTPASKHNIMSGLDMAMGLKDIRFLQNDALILEMQAYEKVARPGGLPAYSAPQGMHDDIVMAVAIAWHGAFDEDWRLI